MRLSIVVEDCGIKVKCAFFLVSRFGSTEVVENCSYSNISIFKSDGVTDQPTQAIAIQFPPILAPTAGSLFSTFEGIMWFDLERDTPAVRISEHHHMHFLELVQQNLEETFD